MSKRTSNAVSSISPLYRPKQSDAVTRAVLKSAGSLVVPAHRGEKVQLLFVRGYYLNSMGKKGRNDRAIYDDAVFVCSPEGVAAFNANSDPSAWRKRIATIRSNQAIRYKPGLHGYKRKGGPYSAFRQDAPCVVDRDGAGSQKGMFAVNLHRGGLHGTSSAGCLTIPAHQWEEFRSLINGLLRKHDQKTFQVVLLEYEGGKPPIGA